MKIAHRLLYWPLALLGGGVAWADGVLDPWDIRGSNTVRLETYRVRGDPLAGPYRHDGPQHYDEFNVSALRRLSPYDTLQIQLYGVVNDSAYRAPEQGLLPERVNITREKGDAAIPYRFEAGDYFAYFSYRTLQRSLKGAQVELQPTPGASGLRQSVLLVSGANQPDWRRFQLRDHWTNGVSWLIEGPRARFTANLLHNHRQADPGIALQERRQTVGSVTGDFAWQWAGQRLRLEGELAGFNGDHDGRADATGAIVPGSGRDRSGQGLFLQWAGHGIDQPVDYRLRFERYDRDFRPVDAVITPDHRSAEAHLGWRFASGVSLRGRALHFIDALQSGNRLETKTYGAQWSGPFFTGWVDGLSGNVDAFFQDIQRQDRSIDRGVRNLNAHLVKPLSGQWVGNFGLFWQDVDDRVPGAPDVRSAHIQLGATRAISLGGWTGTFSPGIAFRRVRGGAAGLEEWSPALAFSLHRHAHSISGSYGHQKLKPDAASLATIEVNALRLDYRYTRGRNTFGIEASAYDREVTIGQFNDSYRLSVYWTHFFDKPARLARASGLAMSASPGVVPADIGLLSALHTGLDMPEALARVEKAGLRGAVRQGNLVVFERGLLGEIEQRQRLVVQAEAGQVARTALIVELDDPHDASGVAQTYERVRKALLDRHGAPALTFEEGDITATLAADLNAGRVIRVMEWSTPTGVLRLGLPRRLDGHVRIEIQHADRFGPPRDALWSIEALR